MKVYLAGENGKTRLLIERERERERAMRIYLAGGISGNLSADWRRSAEQNRTEQNRTSTAMKIYIAGEHPCKNGTKFAGGGQLPYILESFYYCRNNPWITKVLSLCGDFLLDSGAFTFMQDSRTHLDWDKYTEEYSDWINKHNIDKFFELDIDSVVGLEEVERLRGRLESLTGKKPIPVWHKSRGVAYFKKMCDDYRYVALGGIASKEIPKEKFEAAFPWFINEAHKRGAKIHGLGYTSIDGLHKFRFDSVDSTCWLYGNRGGYLYHFDPVKGTMEQYKIEGRRLKSHESAVHNFNEWLKFQRYAERFL